LIRLHEHEVGAALLGDATQFADETGGHALSAMAFLDGQVVDIDLAARLLEFCSWYAARPPTTSSPLVATTAMKCGLPSSAFK
jgi:hypothetical protein